MSLQGADVLDLFAGTGAIGLEALSRGAASVTFIESEGKVIKFARRNAEELEVAEKCTFLRTDAVGYLQRYAGPPYDLVVADPPYDLAAMELLPGLGLAHLDRDGLFILEHDKRIFFDEHPDLLTSRPYGRTYVSVFRPSPAEPRFGAGLTPDNAESGDNADNAENTHDAHNAENGDDVDHGNSAEYGDR